MCDCGKQVTMRCWLVFWQWL